MIKNADMSEDMQQDAVDCASQALEKFNIEKDIAAFIKKEFDKKYTPVRQLLSTWSAVPLLSLTVCPVSSSVCRRGTASLAGSECGLKSPSRVAAAAVGSLLSCVAYFCCLPFFFSLSRFPRSRQLRCVALLLDLCVFVPSSSHHAMPAVLVVSSGSYVTHETKHFIYFYLGQVAVLLFKSG